MALSSTKRHGKFVPMDQHAAKSISANGRTTAPVIRRERHSRSATIILPTFSS